jgi:hypothetical protein
MAKTKRINKKHFIIYNNGGVISATTPKDWARANQDYFPKFSFVDSKNTPTVEVIEKRLSKLGFSEVNNSEIVIFYTYKNI